MSTEQSLKARALTYLARREYTRAELEAKLSKYSEDTAEIRSILEEFERRGWLSEERVLEQLIQVRGRKFGKARIAHEAREKGINEDLITNALPQMTANELDSAYIIWNRKFGKLPADMKERAKQIRFLLSRGFSAETCNKVLSKADEEQGI